MKTEKIGINRWSLILIVIVLITFLSSSPVYSRQDSIGMFDPIQGLVQHQPPDVAENEWNTLSRAQFIYAGDAVRTGHLGLAYLTLLEGIEIKVMPDTVLEITGYDAAHTNSLVMSLSVLAGNIYVTTNESLNVTLNCSIHTPNAALSMSGPAEAWISVSGLSETHVAISRGTAQISGIALDGQVSAPVTVGQNQAVDIFPLGQLGAVKGLDPARLEQLPPDAPLAPATCGNAVCETPGEDAANCAVDCLVLTSCGNQTCEHDLGEGPITCGVDCIPQPRQPTVAVVPVLTPTVTPRPPTSPQPETCTVQTDQPYVNIRVGPGSNRGVRTDMPRNRAIPVVGKAIDRQGNTWWKIQPPNYNPAEADRYWVAANDVNESGDCELIQDVAASAIVAPPPQAPPPTEAPPQPAQPAQPAVPAAPTFPPEFISFTADRYNILLGECVTIRWDVEGIREVYFQGQGVTGHGSRDVCPGGTTTYVLTIIRADLSTTQRTVQIQVN